MVRSFIILIASLFTFSAQGQNPGYLGKKLIGYYELNCTPVVELLTNSINPRAFSFKHGLGAEYTISRSLTAGVAVQFQDFNTYGLGIVGNNWSERNFVMAFRSKHRAISAQLRHFRFKRRGDIAPLGRYGLYEAGYTRMTVTDDGTFLPSGKKTITSYDSWFVMIGGGRTGIHFDKLLLDFGLKLGYVLGTFKDEDDLDVRLYDPLKQMVLKKWEGNFLLNLYLRVGLVAF